MQTFCLFYSIYKDNIVDVDFEILSFLENIWTIFYASTFQ